MKLPKSSVNLDFANLTEGTYLILCIGRVALPVFAIFDKPLPIVTVSSLKQAVRGT